ncbi:HpcH/HpaI aldolase family protein [Ahrensia kielensis]|uniref:HpcH/HpaI aldolase family protein n=1 Tax=Ahrensia kielensis TaxID=76980 RepID=UPI00036DA8D6|nr:HpcH/HpaI aldolase/citrate lyase family protein [Ahrensia kielensis]
MRAPLNDFKRRLLANETLDGIWMSLTSPVASEGLSLIGYDWLLFDTEHAPIETSQVQPLLQAASAGESNLVVRPAWNDKVLIKRVLDIGAQTVLIPFVQNGEEAAAAVAATRYPPHGIRGVAGGTRASRFGLATDYFEQADQQIAVLVQVETVDALSKLEEIASVPGVNGVFIGPSDLAASFGHLGNPGHEEVQAALKDAVTRLKALGVPAGILATNTNDAKRYREWGYAFVSIAVDLGLLMRGASEALKDMRSK